MNEAAYKKILQQAFDQASEGYDLPAMRFFDNSARALAECLPLRGNENILDVACGTGKIALSLAGRLSGGRVTGIDLSEGMLNRARAKAAEAKFQNVSFLHSDVDRLDFPERSFDGLCCGFGVHFWTDMETPMRRLIRMVRPGGFVALTSFAKGSFEPLSDLVLERFRRYGIKLPATYTWERLDNPGKNRDLLINAGAASVELNEADMGHPLAGVEAWWQIVQFTGFRSFLNQFSPERAERFRKEHWEEISELARRQGGLQLKAPVIFAVARVGGE